MSEPRVIYQPKPGSPIDVDREFYGRLGQDTEGRSLVERFIVPIRSGRAWPVLAGQICRIVVVEGAQVADFNAWNLNNPRERFWAALPSSCTGPTSPRSTGCGHVCRT